jgi:hypothetical protein
MYGVRPSGGHCSIDPQLRMGVGDFDTKAAIIVRDDLAQWQRLSVTAFLISGVVGGARFSSVSRIRTLTAAAISPCCANRCSFSRRVPPVPRVSSCTRFRPPSCPSVSFRVLQVPRMRDKSVTRLQGSKRPGVLQSRASTTFSQSRGSQRFGRHQSQRTDPRPGPSIARTPAERLRPNKGNSLRSPIRPHSFADSLTSDGDGATADFGTDRSPKQPRGDVSARDPV